MTEDLYPEIYGGMFGYHRQVHYERRAGIIPCAHYECKSAWATAFKPPELKARFYHEDAPEGSLGRLALPFYACEGHRPPGYRDLDRSALSAPICEHCGALAPGWVPSATAYSWNATALPPRPTAWDWLRFTTQDDFGPDPNRAQALCKSCAEEYHDWWDEQWREYRASQL